MDRPNPQLPVHLARLVQTTQTVDLAQEIRSLLTEGRRRLTLGLGPGVDIPLLDEELYAADVELIDRQLVVAAIRAEPDGYVVERGWSNFGVYVFTAREPLWTSVPHMGSVRGLRPGDQVGLGSTPAEAIRFTLPESALVPPPVAVRTSRQRRAAQQWRAHPKAPASPQPLPHSATRGGALPPGGDPGRAESVRAESVRAGSAPAEPAAHPEVAPAQLAPAEPAPVDRGRFQEAFEIALLHWRYAMNSFGTDPGSVIVLSDPGLGSLRAAIGRNLEQPDRGYDLFVKDPGSGVWVQPTGEAATPLQRGAVIRLKGPGNRIGFGGYVVELPPPAVPVPRFGPHDVPDPESIASVLGLPPAALEDPGRVKAAYRALARLLHPDRHNGEPGHLSRFLEIKLCFEAWKREHS
ncbi:MAG TPA: hypothetical protein ENK18_04350 [Deltaproteobacteria bacterium]|nr:hypothetical protein [Deltaproteobacteria bacterium]